MNTYINGSSIGVTQPGQASNDNGNSYIIGARWDGGSFITGEIGEVSIYGYPLSQDQVTANYNSSSATYN
jgi:hypothetical protein